MDQEPQMIPGVGYMVHHARPWLDRGPSFLITIVFHFQEEKVRQAGEGAFSCGASLRALAR